MARRHSVPDIPTAEVKRKEFVEYQQVRGEVKARNSVTISAPFGAGDLQILTVSKTGTVVKKGDVIVQFDTTPVRVNFEQKQSGLRSADAQIRQSDARARLDQEQRKTDMLTAEYNVERAQLDARKQEILSDIEAEKTRLVLADQQQKLTETKVKVDSSEAGGRASTESVKLKRSKALMDVNLAQRQLQSLTLHAPIAGLITLSPNYRASGSSGSNAPEFKPGDRAWAGALIAEIPDLTSLRVIVHVDEIDRGQLKLNQSALIHVDAVPDREFNATVAEISTLGKPDFSTWPPPRNFDVVLQIKDLDPRLRPGMSANVRIVLDRIPDSIVVPSEAVFEKNGRTIVYVLRGSKFVERAVTIASRASGECLISSGLGAGERVALKDPNPEAESR
jgi:RND family efflux transporter MFP subunit